MPRGAPFFKVVCFVTMRILVPVLLLGAYLAGSAQSPEKSNAGCGPAGTAHIRTTLYFGLNHPTGTVSESQWRAFLGREVTPRFPDGLTVWEADGQWKRPDGRIARERAKVMLLVHNDSPAVRERLGEVVGAYKRAFQQESVMWESAAVCAAF